MTSSRVRYTQLSRIWTKFSQLSACSALCLPLRPSHGNLFWVSLDPRTNPSPWVSPLAVVPAFLHAQWNSHRDPQDMKVSVPPHLAELILWWADSRNLLEGVPLSPPLVSERIFTDASTQGWGAPLGGQTFQGLWSVTERSLHINGLEMRAVRLPITQLAPVPLSVVLVATDNASWFLTSITRGGRGLSGSGPRLSC